MLTLLLRAAAGSLRRPARHRLMRQGRVLSAVLLLVASGCVFRHAPPQPPPPPPELGPSSPSPASRQTVVLISLDGFGASYLDRPGASHLRALSGRGVRAERMVPAFPSKTFPSHYTLVTGLYPEHHGIVGNSMQDPVLGRFTIGAYPAMSDARWWGGEPIWVTSERQGVRTAIYFWPGSEAPVGGVRPTWWTKYDITVSRADRVKGILAWLALPADSAPRLVATYFSDVDDAGHSFGPLAPQVDSAIARVDSAVGAIVDGISRLPASARVNVIVASDHGMTAISPDRAIYLDDFVSLDSLDVVDWTPVAMIAPKPGRAEYVYSKLKGAHSHLAVYRKADVPARFRFNDSPRITPVVGIADEGWSITTHARAAQGLRYLTGGSHGYDNLLPSMGALFVAAGPAFREGVRVPPFESVHIYSLLADILAVKPARTDGSLDSVRALLR